MTRRSGCGATTSIVDASALDAHVRDAPLREQLEGDRVATEDGQAIGEDAGRARAARRQRTDAERRRQLAGARDAPGLAVPPRDGRGQRRFEGAAARLEQAEDGGEGLDLRRELGVGTVA